MRSRLGGNEVAFFLSIGVLLSVLLSGCSLQPGSNGASPSQINVSPPNNPIVRENALPGTSSWKIPDQQAASIQIQAYASATSVQPGQRLTFYVSTQTEGYSFSISIYRLGWYGGLGGRLITTIRHLTGFAQGYYDLSSHRLVDCGSCRIYPDFGLVEANWLPSYTLTIPSDWVTGVYLAKFTDANNIQTYASFDVRGNAHSVFVAVTSNTTDAAYNSWGGYSLYEEYDSTNEGTSNLQIGRLGHGVKVSFDRPYVRGNGSGHVLIYEADTIHWLERQGYDLSYMSSVDLHEDPAQLLQHRVYLSLGHDEYWTKEMRDGVEHARDSGVSLAFLGANAAYWQMRFEPDSAGNPDRTIVCYKVATASRDLARDPFYGSDNTQVTALWRDPVLARPENALIGVMYSDLTQQQRGFPWRVSPQSKSPLLNGTGLRPGQSYGCGLVGNEWDRVFNNGATPRGLQILGESATIDNDNHPDISDTTYYIASSGALVFATGSIYWTAALDNYRFITDKLCAKQDIAVPAIQKLMLHIMTVLASPRLS